MVSLDRTQNIGVIQHNPFDEEITIQEPNREDRPLHAKIGDVVIRVFLSIHRFFGLIAQYFHSSKNKTPKEAKYIFTQQYNDSCHISPWMNRKILQTMKESGLQIDKQFNSEGFSRRQWMGKNQEMLTSWHNAIGKIMQPSGEEKYPNLFRLLNRGREIAPNMPHFYDEKGKFAFGGLRGLLEFSEMPFFLIDVEALEKTSVRVLGMNMDFSDMISKEELGLKSSIVNAKGVDKIYNKKTNEFEPIADLPWISIENEDHETRVVKINYDRLPSHVHDTYQIPEKDQVIKMKAIHGLGFDEIGVFQNFGGGLEVEGHTYIIYQMSLLKLMFLKMGVDENNNMMTENHPDYGVHLELQKLFNEDPNCPWHSNNMKKEHLLQYRLAEVFKADPKLFEAAKEVVDTTFGFWENYEKVENGSFRNEHGIPVGTKELNRFLVGKEQALAYYFMQQLRVMWYSSVNPDVVPKSMELGLDNFPSKLLHQYLKKQMKKQHEIHYSEGAMACTPYCGFKDNKASFLDIWKHMRGVLLSGMSGTDSDFVSFDDHGWLISFDPKVIQLQDNSPTLHDQGMLNELGFAGIESWMSSELNLWYKRKVEIL